MSEKEIREAIAELQLKHNALTASDIAGRNIDAEHEKRIAELEKEVFDTNQQSRIDEALADLNEREQQISEVRKFSATLYDMVEGHRESIAALKEQLEDMDGLRKYIRAIESRQENLESVLKDVQLKAELIAGYVLTQEQFEYVFNDDYWENKKLSEGK